MTAPSRIALVILGAAIGGCIADAQGAPAEAAPAAGEPLLGRVHVWVGLGQADLDDAAAREWGVDREGHFALEVYGAGHPREFYFGGGITHWKTGRATAADGDTIRDFDFLSVELSEKKAFDLTHGLSWDVGLGGAMFYVDGEEVTMQGGQELSDPLADIGFGLQVFADFNWRARRLLIGLDAKYQWAFDIIDIDYSNFRYGAHLGVAF